MNNLNYPVFISADNNSLYIFKDEMQLQSIFQKRFKLVRKSKNIFLVDSNYSLYKARYIKRNLFGIFRNSVSRSNSYQNIPFELTWVKGISNNELTKMVLNSPIRHAFKNKIEFRDKILNSKNISEIMDILNNTQKTINGLICSQVFNDKGDCIGEYFCIPADNNNKTYIINVVGLFNFIGEKLETYEKTKDNSIRLIILQALIDCNQRSKSQTQFLFPTNLIDFFNPSVLHDLINEIKKGNDYEFSRICKNIQERILENKSTYYDSIKLQLQRNVDITRM